MLQKNLQRPRQLLTTTNNLVESVSRAGVENSGLRLRELEEGAGKGEEKDQSGDTCLETCLCRVPLGVLEWSLTTTASSWNPGGEMP